MAAAASGPSHMAITGAMAVGAAGAVAGAGIVGAIVIINNSLPPCPPEQCQKCP
jgi:hypothetical protein